MYKLLQLPPAPGPAAQAPEDAGGAKTSRRDLMGVATILFAPAAHAATSEELKAMMGGLESELSDEALAKARNGVEKKDDGGGFGIELPSIKAPNFAPKEGKPRPKPRAKKESSGDGGGIELSCRTLERASPTSGRRSARRAGSAPRPCGTARSAPTGTARR